MLLLSVAILFFSIFPGVFAAALDFPNDLHVATSAEKLLQGPAPESDAFLQSLVNDGGAANPITADPLFFTEAKLTASDGSADDRFGAEAAISGDTLVVGAPFDDDQGNNSGSAYVFVRSGGSWIQQAKLTASDGARVNNFGVVAISGDTLVVGAPGNMAVDSGSAYVFVRIGGSWIQQAKLTAGEGAANDFFGSPVAISGETLAVGAVLDDGAGVDSGSAYVFMRSGGSWAPQAKLTAGDGAAGNNFGVVAISGDTLVVGARFDDDQGNNSGSAYVYEALGGIAGCLAAQNRTPLAGIGVGLQQPDEPPQLTTADNGGCFYFANPISGKTAAFLSKAAELPPLVSGIRGSIRVNAAPLTGALVLLQQPDEPIQATTTDEVGAFHFGNLTVGKGFLLLGKIPEVP